MKRCLILGIIVFFNQLSIATIVSYELTALGGSSFEYVYTIENDSLGVPIEQFTIWFDELLYDNLQITTQLPLANDWDEIILPTTGFGVPLGYDALALTGGIGIGQTVGGFSISFGWLGSGLPGNQMYEIVNPANNQTIDSSSTVPEPTAVILLGIGSLMLNAKSQKRRG
jgi:hypothetical protein